MVFLVDVIDEPGVTGVPTHTKRKERGQMVPKKDATPCGTRRTAHQTTMTTMTTTMANVHRILLRWAIPLSILFHGALVVTVHASGSYELLDRMGGNRSNSYGSNNVATHTTFWERLKAGPEAYTNQDRIFFAAFITLAFEVLQVLTKNSGRKYYAVFVLPFVCIHDRGCVFLER